MSDNERAKKRLFMKTSHGALHRPGCPRLKRLQIPPEEVWYDPDSASHYGMFFASCCGFYGYTNPSHYGWGYGESGGRLRPEKVDDL